uniref:YEATS domain-containing protein n=1 Tax=Schistocephalus solidus TaxID=70667 RepID=A0A0X3NZM1_SCHSO
MGGDKQALFVFKVGHSVHRKSKPTITKTHHWRCYVESWNKKYPLSAFVEKVTFKLHDTFENPKQIVRKAPFAIEEDGFGNFQLLIEVNFLDLVTSFTYDITLFERSELHAYRTVRLDTAPEDWPRFTRLGGIAIPVSATQADVQQLLRSIQTTPNQEALHAYSFFPHLADDPAVPTSLTAPALPDRGTISPGKNRPSREARSQALANLGVPLVASDSQARRVSPVHSQSSAAAAVAGHSENATSAVANVSTSLEAASTLQKHKKKLQLKHEAQLLWEQEHQNQPVGAPPRGASLLPQQLPPPSAPAPPPLASSAQPQKERLVLKLSISELESKGFRVSKKSKKERKHESLSGGGGVGSGGSSSGGSISRRHKHRLRTTDSPAAISDQVASCTPSPARSAGGTSRAPLPPVEQAPRERYASTTTGLPPSPSASSPALSGRKRGAGGGKPAALTATLLSCSSASAASPDQQKSARAAETQEEDETGGMAATAEDEGSEDGPQEQLPLPRKLSQPRLEQAASPFGVSGTRMSGDGARKTAVADPVKGCPVTAAAGITGKRSNYSRDEVRHHRKSAASTVKSDRQSSDKRNPEENRRLAKEEVTGTTGEDPFQNTTEEATMMWISRLNGGPQPLVSPLSPAASHSSDSEEVGAEQQAMKESDVRAGSQRSTGAPAETSKNSIKKAPTTVATAGRGSSKPSSLKRPAPVASESVPPPTTAKRKNRKSSPQQMEPPPAPSPSAHSVSSADSSTPPMSVEEPCVEMPQDARGRRCVVKADEQQQHSDPEADEGEVLCLDNDALELLFERLLRLENAALAQRMGYLLLKYTASAGNQSKADRRPAGAELLHSGPPAQMIAFDLRRLPLDCIIQLVELITEDESLAAAAASANHSEALRKPGSGTAAGARDEPAATASGKTQTAKEMTSV